MNDTDLDRVFRDEYGRVVASLARRFGDLDEAIRLARLLHALLPHQPEVTGLLALLLLTDARRASRFAGGQLVPLSEQDRAGWDRALVAEGHALVRECLATNRPGRYQLPLSGYHAWHATRADLLRRLGRTAEAGQEYAAAIDATGHAAEVAYLSRRRERLV